MREIAEESPGEFSQKISRILFDWTQKNQHHFSTACEHTGGWLRLCQTFRCIIHAALRDETATDADLGPGESDNE